MGADVLGVDLRPPEDGAREFRFSSWTPCGRLCRVADVAVMSVCLVHHLRDEEYIEMIRNVGRACRRFSDSGPGTASCAAGSVHRLRAAVPTGSE